MTDALHSAVPEVKGRSHFQLAVMRFRRNRPAMAGAAAPTVSAAAAAAAMPNAVFFEMFMCLNSFGFRFRR